ncbi:hypothetical protein GOBAR_AA00011 [Gossypium barbadense]|uniref:Uncharacterized protein n=1 Tax=Gossypium barbadense TaxID=3634 RepID=A0A2P5YY73_GOSBA|nr:hypothetical protein GOBAR_AA00011 [Gossypium barbadense]
MARVMQCSESMGGGRLTVLQPHLVDAVVRLLSAILGDAQPFDTRVSNPFSFPDNNATSGLNNGHAIRGPHVMTTVPPPMDNQIVSYGLGLHAYGCYGAPRPHNTGHGVGPYSSSISGDPSASQYNGPSVDLVRLKATSNASVRHRALVDTNQTVSTYVPLVKFIVPCPIATREGTINDMPSQSRSTFVPSPSRNHDPSTALETTHRDLRLSGSTDDDGCSAQGPASGLCSSAPPPIPTGNPHNMVTRSKARIFKPKALTIEVLDYEPRSVMDIIQFHCLVSGIGAYDIGRGNEDKTKSVREKMADPWKGHNTKIEEQILRQYCKLSTDMPYGFWSFKGNMRSWQFNLLGELEIIFNGNLGQYWFSC